VRKIRALALQATAQAEAISFGVDVVVFAVGAEGNRGHDGHAASLQMASTQRGSAEAISPT